MRESNRPRSLAGAVSSMPVQVNSRTDRLMARIAVVIFCGGLIYGTYSLGGPVWWRFYATVIHPFEDNSTAVVDAQPFADAKVELAAGKTAAGVQVARR